MRIESTCALGVALSYDRGLGRIVRLAVALSEQHAGSDFKLSVTPHGNNRRHPDAAC
jgi:hypothetical protein